MQQGRRRGVCPIILARLMRPPAAVVLLLRREQKQALDQNGGVCEAAVDGCDEW